MTADVEQAILRIAVAWRTALGRALHGPNCGCCGGQPVVLKAGALAEGIEHGLRSRYRGAADAQPGQLLDARPLAPDQDLVDWLRALAAEAPPEGMHAILGTVGAMIDSIGDGPAHRR